MFINKNSFKFIFTKEFFKSSIIFIIMWIIFSILELIGISTIPLILSAFLDNNQLYQIPILHNFYSSFNLYDNENYLIYFLVLIIFVFLIKNLFFVFLVFVETKIYKSISLVIKKKIFEYYFHLPFESHLKQNSSDVVRKITLDTGNAITYVISFLTFISQLILFSVVISFLFINNFLVTFVALGFFLIIFSLIYLYSNDRLVKLGKEKQIITGEIIKIINESINSIKEVILYNKNSFLNSIFSKKQNQVQQTILKITLLKRIPKSIYEFLSIVLISMMMLFLTKYNSLDDSLVFVTLFVVSLLRLLPAMNLSTLNISNMKATEYSFNLIYEKLNLIKHNSLHKAQGLKNSEIFFSNKIEFKNISFSYDKKEVFENLNFIISKNSFIGIYGESGSGKSTLVNLLCGLLNSKEGEILIDEKNINDVKNSWQSKIGYIPQDIYILDDSIKNNIIFNDENNTNIDKDLKNVIEISQLNRLIDSFNDGLDTKVGDRGINISGGQRQRIAIARALYHKPDVLIFDEATNSLDEITENNLMDSIYEIKGKTIIIISHNPKTLNRCEKIFKIEGKSVREIKKIN
tara:strand:- start:18111 stop:19841 length:1731 start_codon:yes stop_codon:yes gene_type:complete